jgi:hypothetical protein
MAVYDFQSGETIIGRVTHLDFEEGETIVARRRTAAGQPFWGEKPLAWDTVTVAGRRLPGIARVSGTAMEHRTDRQKTRGKSGAKIVLQGYEPAPFEVVLLLWTEEHLRTFESLIPVLKPRYPVQRSTPGPAPSQPVTEEAAGAMGMGGIRVRDASGNLVTYAQFATAVNRRTAPRTRPARGPAPVDVAHPALAMWGIRSAQVLSVGFPEPRAEGGDGREVRIKCLEWVGRRGAAVVAPTASGTDFTAGVPTAYSFTAPPSRERPSLDVGPTGGF